MPAEGMPVAQINRGGFIVPPGPKSLGGVIVYCAQLDLGGGFIVYRMGLYTCMHIYIYIYTNII